MFRLNSLELGIEKAPSTTNPLLDESGQFVKPEEAVRNFSTLWKEWDLVNKFFDKLPTIIIGFCQAYLHSYCAFNVHQDNVYPCRVQCGRRCSRPRPPGQRCAMRQRNPDSAQPPV